MRYIVSMAVDGRIDIPIEADSPEEAKVKAEIEFMSADITKMEVVGSHPVNCTDEHDNITDYD